MVKRLKRLEEATSSPCLFSNALQWFLQLFLLEMSSVSCHPKFYFMFC